MCTASTFVSEDDSTLSVTFPDGSSVDVPMEIVARSTNLQDLWTFFRAISKLKSLKKLSLPKRAGTKLTACGVDTAAPMEKLPGLEVVDVHDGRIIASVEGDTVHVASPRCLRRLKRKQTATTRRRSTC